MVSLPEVHKKVSLVRKKKAMFLNPVNYSQPTTKSDFNESGGKL